MTLQEAWTEFAKASDIGPTPENPAIRALAKYSFLSGFACCTGFAMFLLQLSREESAEALADMRGQLAMMRAEVKTELQNLQAATRKE